MKIKLALFLMALVQVSLVSCNVIFISRGNIPLMIITGFFISMTWSFNIKKIAIGSKWDRVAYAIGSALGTYAGYLISHLILK